MIRKLLGMKTEIDSAVKENEKSIERAEHEVEERKMIDARLKHIQIELDNMMRK